MGFLKTIQLDNGLTVDNAYFKIDYISGNKESITVYLKSYVNRDASINGLLNLSQVQFSFTPELEDTSSNFYKQGYDYIKTQPDYQNVTDVLENE